MRVGSFKRLAVLSSAQSELNPETLVQCRIIRVRSYSYHNSPARGCALDAHLMRMPTRTPDAQSRPFHGAVTTRTCASSECKV